MMGTLVEDMLGNWSLERSTMFSAKSKLTDLDNQLNGLDATFFWKYLASEQRQASNTKVGCGNATGGKSMEKGPASI